MRESPQVASTTAAAAASARRPRRRITPACTDGQREWIGRYARNTAPKRSASAATIPFRIAAASSSESVRSGDWNAAASAIDFFPSPTCSPAIDVEDAQLAELRPGSLAGGSDQVTGGDRLVDDEREILLHRGIGDHVLVGNDRRHVGEELVEVELEVAQAAGQLGELAVVRARGATPTALEHDERHRERAMQRLGGALGPEEAARRDPCDVPVLLGQLLADRPVDPSDLEERDFLDPGVPVPLGRPSRPRRRSGRSAAISVVYGSSSASLPSSAGTRLQAYASE